MGGGGAVQTFVSLMSLLITNWLTVVAQVFSNTLIFLLQKCKQFLQLLTFFQHKILMYFPNFKIEILMSR